MLAWALDRYQHVETIGFDYGQRHAVELECRAGDRTGALGVSPLGAKLGEDHILDLSLLGQISDTALTQDKAIEFEKNGLPNTFVPGRNLLFFTFAAAIAYRRGLECSLAACARPTTPAIQIAETTRSRRCRWPSVSGWTARW